MEVSCCPECGGDHFLNNAMRADAVDPANPERYAQVYGHWFNQCKGCGGWSIYKDGVNHHLDDPMVTPVAYSEPAIE